ncbi:MAG TPA: DNA-binding protein [Fuerstia sp.]|nr:DNA-binding protein [Fuerstiella sp.]
MPKHGEVTLPTDSQGRVLNADGMPAGGLASVTDVVRVTQFSKAYVYKLIADGDLESKRFGRSVRVPWSVVRSIVGPES